MSSDTPTATTPKWMFWTGWVLSILPAAMLVMSGTFKLAAPIAVAESSKDIGWDNEHLIVALGLLELACVFVYVVPPTAVLGAVLMTGYIGGAIATHVRVGEMFVVQVLLGVLVWAGLWLRDARLRSILPWRG